ncbi:MAG: hypothetical protein M1836_006754 [Candelina mexicana]|nr:MAG: hypothetical protein M1836_006754 [Candelina mexicana]
MASPRDSKNMTDEEWEQEKDRIYYFVCRKNVPYANVVKQLEANGRKARQWKLQAKLSEWGFNKGVEWDNYPYEETSSSSSSPRSISTPRDQTRNQSRTLLSLRESAGSDTQSSLAGSHSKAKGIDVEASKVLSATAVPTGSSYDSIPAVPQDARYPDQPKAFIQDDNISQTHLTSSAYSGALSNSNGLIKQGFTHQIPTALVHSTPLPSNSYNFDISKSNSSPKPGSSSQASRLTYADSFMSLNATGLTGSFDDDEFYHHEQVSQYNASDLYGAGLDTVYSIPSLPQASSLNQFSNTTTVNPSVLMQQPRYHHSQFSSNAIDTPDQSSPYHAFQVTDPYPAETDFTHQYSVSEPQAKGVKRPSSCTPIDDERHKLASKRLKTGSYDFTN